MKKILLSLFLLVLLITPSYSATIVKAISVTQLAMDEKIISFYSFSQNKINLMLTDKNMYIISPPASGSTFYGLEKIPFVLQSGEVIKTVYWNDATGMATAFATNLNIYFFLYN